MQVQRKMSDRLVFTAEANTQKELFEKLAEIDKASEVFGIEQCGVCKNRNIKFQMRSETAKTGKNKGKTFKFYELLCGNTKCRSKFSFGQLQTGTELYPKKKDGEGNYLEHNGWVKYESQKDDTETEVGE